MSGPILKLATTVLHDLDDAIKHAPHSVPSGNGDRHVRALQSIKRDVQLVVNLAGEAADLERGLGADYQGMLYELMETVQLQSGNQGPCTADQAGLDSAMAEVRKMTLVLAPQPGDADALRGKLLEAVRARDGVSWTPRHPGGGDSFFAAVTTQAIPREHERVVVDGHPYNCGPAEHDGMSCVVPLKFAHGYNYPAVVRVPDPDAVQAEAPN